MSNSDPFQIEAFRRRGHQLIDQLADYLAQVESEAVLPVVAPEQLLARVNGEFREEPGEDLLKGLARVLKHSIHVHHPGYVGHQVAAVLPDAVLAEMLSALLNNGMAVYEMGQMHSVLERQVIAFLAAQIGYGEGAGGVLTGGGSVGNLTALLAARQIKAKDDVWRNGQSRPFAVMVSGECHYSISRAVQIMGWGAGGVYRVPTGPEHTIEPSALLPTLRQAERDGRQVLALVANVCSTGTGAFDPLPCMADFCRDHGLWLHADGAHGASFLLSPAHRHLLTGIERADSVVWDMHKMMLLPSTITALLYRNESHSYAPFAQEASYLFNSEERDEEWYHIGKRTLECTKRGMATVVHTLLHHHGLARFREHLEHVMQLAQHLAKGIRAHPHFELAGEPQANIVCFRYSGPSPLALDDTQAALRTQLLVAGNYYLVQTEIQGQLYLRTTLINPATTEGHLDALIQELDRLGQTLQ